MATGALAELVLKITGQDNASATVNRSGGADGSATRSRQDTLRVPTVSAARAITERQSSISIS